jgi:hypothetical protein
MATTATRLTTPATFTLAALSNDRSRFANKVREQADQGDANPFFSAVRADPHAYNEWRSSQGAETSTDAELGGMVRSYLARGERCEQITKLARTIPTVFNRAKELGVI